MDVLNVKKKEIKPDFTDEFINFIFPGNKNIEMYRILAFFMLYESIKTKFFVDILFTRIYL
jgi:hypothetical protein